MILKVFTNSLALMPDINATSYLPPGDAGVRQQTIAIGIAIRYKQQSFRRQAECREHD